MPILPAVPGLMRLDLDWETQVKNWTTFFHVLKSIAGPWATADMNAALTSVTTGIESFLLPRFGAATTSTATTAMDLSSSMGTVLTTGGAGSGTGIGTRPLPMNVALRSSYVSPLRYRGGRPGNFWAGLDQTDVSTGDNSRWSTTVVSNWLSSIQEFIEQLNGTVLPSGASMQAVFVSYFSDHAMRPTPLTFPLNATGGVEIQTRICSKRRRLGRGVPGE